MQFSWKLFSPQHYLKELGFFAGILICILSDIEFF